MFEGGGVKGVAFGDGNVSIDLKSVKRIASCLVSPSGDLGNVYALPGELGNELHLKRTGRLQSFQRVSRRQLYEHAVRKIT